MASSKTKIKLDVNKPDAAHFSATRRRTFARYCTGISTWFRFFDENKLPSERQGYIKDSLVPFRFTFSRTAFGLFNFRGVSFN